MSFVEGTIAKLERWMEEQGIREHKLDLGELSKLFKRPPLVDPETMIEQEKKAEQQYLRSLRPGPRKSQ